MKKKKRQLRPSIRKALDYFTLTAVTLSAAYIIIRLALFAFGFDL